MNRLIAAIDITAASPGITEPVTVQDIKDYLRLEGFIDDSDSISTEFDDDDSLIEDLITASRERLELFTGLSFVAKTWQIEFDNPLGWFELPHGPVTSITSVSNLSGDDVTYTVTIDLAKIKTPCLLEMQAEYEAGYDVLPVALKQAMLTEIAYRYIHRGDEFEDSGICNAAMVLASPFKEVDTWLA